MRKTISAPGTPQDVDNVGNLPLVVRALIELLKSQHKQSNLSLFAVQQSVC